MRDYASTTLPEIQKATERRLALRISHDLTEAAARLGMAPAALSRWLERCEARDTTEEDSEE